MKRLLKLFLILGIILPSTAFGMKATVFDLKKLLSSYFGNANRENCVSSEPSLNASVICSPRHVDAENINLANIAAQLNAQANATAANEGILRAADRFTAHAQRSTPKAPRLNIRDRGITTREDSTHAVKEDEWDDLAKFDDPTPTPVTTSSNTANTQSIDIDTVWNSKLEDPAPIAPPFPDNIHIDINNAAQNDPAESPRLIPDKPTAPELGHQIPEEYVDAPAPATPTRRPLPSSPIAPPILNSNHPKNIDEEPFIEEMAEPIDGPVEDQESVRAKLTAQEREETDFTQFNEPKTRGVREEINRTLLQNQRRHAQQNVRFAPQDRVKPFNPRNPADQVHELDSIIKPAKPGANTASPATSNLGTTSKSASGLNALNLLISAGIFGILSWLENDMAKKEPKSPKLVLAHECISGAQQAAGANIAQQLFCIDPANSFAFTATFAILHACEVGLKKLTTSALRKTQTGKKINAAFSKLPKNKRKVIGAIGMLTGWTIKTLLANAITST